MVKSDKKSGTAANIYDIKVLYDFDEKIQIFISELKSILSKNIIKQCLYQSDRTTDKQDSNAFNNYLLSESYSTKIIYHNKTRLEVVFFNLLKHLKGVDCDLKDIFTDKEMSIILEMYSDFVSCFSQDEFNYNIEKTEVFIEILGLEGNTLLHSYKDEPFAIWLTSFIDKNNKFDIGIKEIIDYRMKYVTSDCNLALNYGKPDAVFDTLDFDYDDYASKISYVYEAEYSFEERGSYIQSNFGKKSNQLILNSYYVKEMILSFIKRQDVKDKLQEKIKYSTLEFYNNLKNSKEYFNLPVTEKSKYLKKDLIVENLCSRYDVALNIICDITQEIIDIEAKKEGYTFDAFADKIVDYIGKIEKPIKNYFLIQELNRYCNFIQVAGRFAQNKDYFDYLNLKTIEEITKDFNYET